MPVLSSSSTICTSLMQELSSTWCPSTTHPQADHHSDAKGYGDGFLGIRLHPIPGLNQPGRLARGAQIGMYRLIVPAGSACCPRHAHVNLLSCFHLHRALRRGPAVSSVCP